MVRIRRIEELTPLEKLHQLRNEIPEGIEPVVVESWTNYMDDQINNERKNQGGR